MSTENTAAHDTFEVSMLFGDKPDEGSPSFARELTIPTPATADGVIAALDKAGVNASDVRTRVGLAFPAGVSTRDLLVTYAAVMGLTGRPVPLAVGGAQLWLEVAVAEVGQLERPDEAIKAAAWSDQLSDSDLHFARRVFVEEHQPALEAAGQFIRLTTIRRRPTLERLPELVAGAQEAVDLVNGSSEDVEIETLRLEEARQAGFRYRTRSTAGEREIAPAGDESPRLDRLNTAADAPIEDVLRRLGSTVDDAGEKWHCPRPERHSNGDKNPSMVINASRTRCFRCDTEPVDALRLAIDTLQVSPDEAADWILSGASR